MGQTLSSANPAASPIISQLPGYETPKLQFRIADSGTLIHTVEIVEGVLAVEWVEMLRGFFEERR